MFKKKQPPRGHNVFEKQWNALQSEICSVGIRMDKLFREIANAKDVIECFPNGADRESEVQHLNELRKQMLAACGTYDGLQFELREVYKEHENEMSENYCNNGLYLPTKNCHDYLRWTAQTFRKYH